MVMRQALERIVSAWGLDALRQALPVSKRERIAVVMAILTFVGLLGTFIFSKGTQFLMPGPLASAHGGIEKCGACHTKSGDGKLSWVHGLVAGDPATDSKACLGCHKMPATAFNAHGAAAEVLEGSTERLTKIAARTPVPTSARAQDIAFPASRLMTRDLYCATCHQEHQGVGFKLSKITNEQCRSCHVVQFDSFDGRHPKFENYPFKQRTPIIYDHAGHFGKHFPEVAKKDPAKRIPATCSTCHSTRDDKRVMAVAPFEQTCTACHLNQIVGKERVSGPKGIAFLTVPGLDVQSLRKKKAAIGEWPEDSEAELTPFMKMMIGRDQRGRAIMKTVASLNLQDLSQASKDQIAAVTDLAWEVKRLFYAMIKGKASDVLGDLNVGGGAKLSPALVADLTASIPRDVVASAQQQWLPNLAAEMANRPVTSKEDHGPWSTVTTESRLEGSAAREELAPSGAPQSAPAPAEDGSAKDNSAERAPPAALPGRMNVGVYDRQTPTARDADNAARVRLAADDAESDTGLKRVPLPSGTSRAIESRGKRDGNESAPERSRAKSEPVDRAPDSGNGTPTPDDEPRAAAPGDAAPAAKDTGKAAESPPESGPPDAASGNNDGASSSQTDDLLSPTEDELRAINAGSAAPKSASPERAASPGDAAPTKPERAGSEPAGSSGPPQDTGETSRAAPAAPQPRAAPVISIESDVDPESWAEYGGWYRQDYAIFYRPTGHKDKFIYSWLFLTGPQAPKGGTSAAAAVFDILTGKDAQGSCTKCHSVDDLQGKGRVVNFAPPSARSKQGQFTTFIHEPHFGILENRGCLTCHKLEKDRPYLKSYEQGNPASFVSNFGDVEKGLCKTCHTAGMARQDCLTCHKYHVNGVITPIMSTKLPTQ